MKKPAAAAKPLPSRRPGRRERRRAETRERIFRAALGLFAERGYLDTTVEEITEAADVGKGTFFNYFPTKEHILSAFSDLQIGKLEEASVAAQGSEPMEHILKHLMRRLAEEPARSQAMVRTVMQALLSSEPVRRQMRENIERGRRVLADLLAIGQRRGEIRRDREPAELARVLHESFVGALMMWSLGPLVPATDWIDATFSVLWSGIRAGRPENAREQLA